MSDDQLRRCVLDELRKAQGEPLAPAELFERCGGAKATNLNVDTFIAFVDHHCSRAVKLIHDDGDENSHPKFALHVDSSRKTGTLKRKARSSSQSSSRGGTPDPAKTRFDPRTDGFEVFCHIVRRLCSNTRDGTVNWNVVRNQYRKDTGRHLNAEELNAMCGTLNLTKHDILNHHLSGVVEVVDRRGQLLRLASPFDPKTPSPISSKSRSPGDASPTAAAAFDENQEIDHDVARRQQIVEQLRKNGVIVDENGRAVTPPEQVTSDKPPEITVDEKKILDEFITPNLSPEKGELDAEEFTTPMSVMNEINQTPSSVDQMLETSGEGGYVTGYDGTPESDVSLDIAVDRSFLDSTPRRTHEITLCHADADSTTEKEEVLESVESVEEVVITEDESTIKDDIEEIAVSPIVQTPSDIEENVEQSDESVSSSDGSIIKESIDVSSADLQLPKSPLTDECLSGSYYVEEVEGPEDEVFEEKESIVVQSQTITESTSVMPEYGMESLEDNEPPSMEPNVLPEETLTTHVKEQVEVFEHLNETDLNQSRSSAIDKEAVEHVDVKEIVHELELSATEPAVAHHEVEPVPAAVPVMDAVHRLEHEFDTSLPLCDEYREIVSHETRRLDAGDAPLPTLFTDKEEIVSEEGAVEEVVCQLDLSRTVVSKTVTVTLGEPAADEALDKHEEACHPSEAAQTKIVVVNVDPEVEDKPKLPESDTWEKEFVVASASTASEISKSLTEANMSAAEEFIREVEVQKKKQAEDAGLQDETKPPTIDTKEIGELSTTEELPAIPITLTERSEAEGKVVPRSKARGRVLMPRRRIIDCCTIL
ncbi:hypothetical protein Q1695_014901 [Nippostrongylus brasiliensis]|nr:hypothetical protein Q1695_014901 [Nippostrongylus brasiliensis]